MMPRTRLDIAENARAHVFLIAFHRVRRKKRLASLALTLTMFKVPAAKMALVTGDQAVAGAILGVDCRVKPKSFVGHDSTTFVPAGRMVRFGKDSETMSSVTCVDQIFAAEGNS